MQDKISIPSKLVFLNDETIKFGSCIAQKAKIYIMHDKKNRNGSNFEVEDIDRCAKRTLFNIPILGYVKTHEDGERDFCGHETDYDVTIDEDGEAIVKEYYLERPYGVIPESNNYYFEEIDGKTYLVSDCILWSMYDNGDLEIILNDEEKEVSMEIIVNEKNTKNGIDYITDFDFTGVTILGGRVQPAMKGAKIEFAETFSTTREIFSKSVAELNKYLKDYLGKEDGDTLENENLDNVENFEEEVCPTCEKNPCECENEEEYSKEDNEAEEDTEETTEDENEDEVEEDKKEKNSKKKKCSEEFSLSINNINRFINESLEGITFEYESFWGDTFNIRKYYVQTLIPSENIAILEDYEEGMFYGVKYEVKNDLVTIDLDNKKRYISEWREMNTSTFQSEEETEPKFALLYNLVAEELKELREFKANVEHKEAYAQLEKDVENKLAEFDFEDEEVSELKEKVLSGEIDLERFEDKLCVLEVKKNREKRNQERENFSANKEVSIPVADSESTYEAEDDLARFINKYTKK